MFRTFVNIDRIIASFHSYYVNKYIYLKIQFSVLLLAAPASPLIPALSIIDLNNQSYKKATTTIYVVHGYSRIEFWRR